MKWQSGLGIACVALSAVTMLTGSVAGAQSLASAQADAVKARRSSRRAAAQTRRSCSRAL